MQWAMYLLMAALSSLPVNFVPLTTSVKVLFSTSSCIFIASYSTKCAGVVHLFLRRDHQTPEKIVIYHITIRILSLSSAKYSLPCGVISV